MSIDIIAGVIQGADPAAASRVKTKLGARDPAASGLFEKILQASTAPKKSSTAETSGVDLLAAVISAADGGERTAALGKLTALTEAPSGNTQTAAEVEAAQQLEKSMLTSVLTQMMPSSSSLYGDDEAGVLVQQFQTDTLAEAAAATEPLGLAKTLYGSQDGTRIVNQAQWPYFARSGITPFAG